MPATHSGRYGVRRQGATYPFDTVALPDEWAVDTMRKEAPSVRFQTNRVHS